MPLPLTILCATRGEPRILPFLADFARLATACGGNLHLVADGEESAARLYWSADALSPQPTITEAPLGRVHTTMQTVVDNLDSDYLFFLDDDERVREPLVNWFVAGHYRAAPAWTFRRAWLWPDVDQYIATESHWPDWQYRLAARPLVTVPTVIHGGWIARNGAKPQVAPSAIEHHKLIIRTRKERQADMARYDAISPGAGSGFHLQYDPDDRGLTTRYLHDGDE